jgi:Hsp20/alpha crystallin family
VPSHKPHELPAGWQPFSWLGYHFLHERHQGELSRSCTLPTHIDAARMQATYGQGVLTLQVPKLEVARPKQIEIKVKELAGVL